jgi:hypothetical protein
VSVRLQVVMDADELDQIRRVAAARGLTVSAWVRQVVQAARRQESSGDLQRKLELIRLSSDYAFPAADIEQMLAETEQGYLIDGE